MLTLERSASQEGAWKQRFGRFLAFGVSLAVIIGVASLRGSEWAFEAAGEILIPILLMALFIHFLPKDLAPKLRGTAYVAAGAVVALLAMRVGFEQYRASQEDTKEVATVAPAQIATPSVIAPVPEDSRAAFRREISEQERLRQKARGDQECPTPPPRHDEVYKKWVDCLQRVYGSVTK